MYLLIILLQDIAPWCPVNVDMDGSHNPQPVLPLSPWAGTPGVSVTFCSLKNSQILFKIYIQPYVYIHWLLLNLLGKLLNLPVLYFLN